MEISGNTEISKKYSIINSPNNLKLLKNNILRFLIMKHEKKGLSAFLHDNVKIGDVLKLNGPFSSFQYNTEKHRPLLGIAGGTGISPILSVVKDELDKENNLSALIFLSVRNRDEILEMDTLQKMREKYKNFSFKITLTREQEMPNNQFLYGRLNLTLQKVFKDLSTHKVLIAGSDKFVDASYKHALSLNTNEKNIFYEKFSEN